jgi:transposase-like protein
LAVNDLRQAILERYRRGDLHIEDLAREAGIRPTTIYRYINLKSRPTGTKRLHASTTYVITIALQRLQHREETGEVYESVTNAPRTPAYRNQP